MALYDDHTGTVPRAAALYGVMVGLVVAAALALWLGWSHIHLTHGTGAFDSLCVAGAAFDCDTVNTSDWGSIKGVPISFYALPLYAMMGLLAWVGRAAGERGARARGGLVLLSGGVVAVSLLLFGVMVFDIGTICLFCSALDLVHLSILGLALIPPGGRRPAFPAGLDMIIAAFLAVVVMGTSFQFALIYAERLDRIAAAEIMKRDHPAQLDARTERREGRVVALPDATWDVPLDRYDPSVGPASATVTVVEFADFECAYCRRLGHNLAPLKQRYSDRVRFVFKHYPMDQACNSRMTRQHHPDACVAARASVCAHAQRQFWGYHDLLFQNQDHLERGDLMHYSDVLGLDRVRFEACLDSEESVAQVREDIAHAGSLDITGTPRVYVNGRMFKGAVSEAMLEAAILMELGEAQTTDDGRVVTARDVVTEPSLRDGLIDMVAVAGAGEGETFFIDAVEASIDAEGRAVALGGVEPVTASWVGARAACEAAGKRLCTAAEWLTACQGRPAVDDDGSGSVLDDYLEGRAYPYGDFYKEGWCFDDADRDARRQGATGARGACRTPSGVHDLTGNLQEWVGADEAAAVLMGGAWYYADKAHCGTSYDRFGPSMANRTTGFRCCADTPVVAEETLEPATLSPGAPLVAPGEGMPSFEGALLAGGSFQSASLTGRVTLINFWASWCTPCRKELPALASLHGRTDRADFEIVAVNVDRNPELAKRFLGSSPLPFPVVLDPDSKIVGRFDVTAMPTSVLVGRDGAVLERHAGYSEAWFSELEARVAAEVAAGR